ncbi:MAG: hypothetical protein WBX38_12085 [Candidatus Sulfotelmatobacter sp.]
MFTSSSDSARKTPANNLNRQLGLYSLAAAAASVSVMALAQPAGGEVVVTRKTVPVVGLVSLDINHDGINDFEFDNFFSFGSADLTVKGAVPGRGGAFVVGQSDYASPVMRGADIGSSARFSPSSASVGVEKGMHVGYSNQTVEGPWGGNPKNRYLGVRFRIDGQIHYGWVRLTVLTQPTGTWSATITAYAYETVPNKAIKAGTAEEPKAELEVPENIQIQTGPSLGMLAAGADSVSLWRREEAFTPN